MADGADATIRVGSEQPQISEALFSRAAGGAHEARSAGTTPAERVHPEVVEAMAELGIDLANRFRASSSAPTPSGPTSS